MMKNSAEKVVSDVASFIAEIDSKRIPGQVYIPILVATNIELQIALSVLHKISDKLDDKDKHAYSAFNLIDEAIISKLIENTRFTFQSNNKAKGLAVLFYECIGNVRLDEAASDSAASNRNKIKKLYSESIKEYQSREIHLHDDRKIGVAINTSVNSEYGYTLNKTVMNLPRIEATKINEMFELLSETANSLRDGRYCHVPRMKLDQVIDSFERLFKIQIDDRDELIEKIKKNTVKQEMLLALPS